MGSREGYKRRTVRLVAWLAYGKFKVYDEDVQAERFYYADGTYAARHLEFYVPRVAPAAAASFEPRRAPTGTR